MNPEIVKAEVETDGVKRIVEIEVCEDAMGWTARKTVGGISIIRRSQTRTMAITNCALAER